MSVEAEHDPQYEGQHASWIGLVLIEGPDSPAPTWYAMEPGQSPLVDEEQDSWSIEFQLVYR